MLGLVLWGQSPYPPTEQEPKTFFTMNPRDNEIIEFLGSFLPLATGATLDSGTIIDVSANAGHAKIRIEFTATVDGDGELTFHGSHVNRDTGAKTDTTETITVVAGDSIYMSSFLMSSNSNDSMYVSTTNIDVTANVDQVSFDQYDQRQFLIEHVDVTVKTQDVPQTKNFIGHLLMIKADGDTSSLLPAENVLHFPADSLKRNSLNRLLRDVPDSLQFVDGRAGDGVMLFYTGTNLSYVKANVYAELY